MNHYWWTDSAAKAVKCPICNVEPLEECITNKGKPHALGYVHKGRTSALTNAVKTHNLMVEAQQKESLV
jgi:hypothetical protein